MKVMVFGTFDVLHPGHKYLLNEAKKRGVVTVVVAQDATVERIKSKKPLESLATRMAAIKKAFPMFTVVAGNNINYAQPIIDHQPNLLLFGYDQILPPGLDESAITIPWERLSAFKPDVYKSSIRRNAKQK